MTPAIQEKAFKKVVRMIKPQPPMVKNKQKY